MINEGACDRIVSAILKAEGGVADVGDGEGVTRWGQTVAWLETWGLPTPHTLEEARANYRGWMAVTNLDQLTGIHEALAHVVIDAAVNEGLSYAVRTLQSAVGAHQDGVIGYETLHAAQGADATRVTYVVLHARLHHYVGLVKADPDRNLRYLGGWTDRIFSNVLAVAGITL